MSEKKPSQAPGKPGSPDRFADPGHEALSVSLNRAFKLVPIGMVLIVLFFLSTGIYRVDPQEKAVKMRFGRVVEQQVPGWYFKWPDPIETTVKMSTSRQTLTTRQFMYSESTQKRIDPASPVKQAIGLKPGVDGYVLTSDRQIVHLLEMRVNYKIDSPEKVLRNVGGAELFPVHLRGKPAPKLEKFMMAVVAPEVVKVVGRYRLDEVYRASGVGEGGAENIDALILKRIYRDAPPAHITARLPEIAASAPGPSQERIRDLEAIRGEVKLAVAAELTRLDCGLVIDDVLFTALPPVGVVPAFAEVTAASTSRSAMIKNAATAAETIKTEAEKRANQIRSEATIYAAGIKASAQANAEALAGYLEYYKVDAYQASNPGKYPPGLLALLEMRRMEVLAEMVDAAEDITVISPGGENEELRFMFDRDPEAQKQFKARLKKIAEERAARAARIK